MPGDIVGVEFDQRLPHRHALAVPHQAAKALAIQLYGIQTDMHQHLHALVADQAQGMSGCLHPADHPGQGRAKGLRGRVDGDAVADQLAGEHRVGNRFEGNHQPREGRQQFQGLTCGHSFTCCSSCSGMGCHGNHGSRLTDCLTTNIRPGHRNWHHAGRCRRRCCRTAHRQGRRHPGPPDSTAHRCNTDGFPGVPRMPDHSATRSALGWPCSVCACRLRSRPDRGRLR
ncbi:hypothetical protein D3C84_826660 [compost metagenome]